jgi:uncharacterized protein (TIGR02453 family)
MATAPASATATEFRGFERGAIQFLTELADHNDRAWFQPRKADYERLLKEPLEALCVAVQERFRARKIPLTADPAKSPFRIYRDVRFSKDKSPYKTNLGASFPWTGASQGAATHAAGGVGGYFHFQPGEMYVGGGMWHPETPRLAAWRQKVLSDGKAVHAAIDDKGFVKEFGAVGGDRLTRPPSGVPADHPDVELLKLKDVTFGKRLSDKDVLSPGLPDLMADLFGASTPVLRLLASLG